MNEAKMNNEYDEHEAIAFVKNYLAQELKGKLSDDDIYYILNTSEKFYEQCDFFAMDDEAEEYELIEYIVKESEKHGVGNYDREDVLFVLRGEEAYFELLYGDINEE
jgi:antitoxin component HigA of HigAB toxin-antitoxin module